MVRFNFIKSLFIYLLLSLFCFCFKLNASENFDGSLSMERVYANHSIVQKSDRLFIKSGELLPSMSRLITFADYVHVLNLCITANRR